MTETIGIGQIPRTDPREIDHVLSVLADGRRRRVLERLSDREEPMTLADLAAAIAAGARDRGEQVTEERVRDSLYHVHVPKLAAADLVTWDREDGVVSLTEAAEPLCSDL